MAQGGSIISTSQIETVCDFGTNAGTNVIGDWGNSSADMFRGKIDDFAIWGRALSSSEISQLYNLQVSNSKLTTKHFSLHELACATTYIHKMFIGIKSVSC